MAKAKSKAKVADDHVSSNHKQDDREKRERFVQEVLKGGSRRAAAITIGIPEKSAAVWACNQMKHPYVKQLFADHKARVEAELEAKHGLTIANVLESLRRLVMGDPRKLFNADGTLKPITELDDATASMVSSFEVTEDYDREGKVAVGRTSKIKMWDKNSAIDKAMRHLGAFERDNKQKPLTVNITAEDTKVL